jgi:hypothetical protein
MPTINLDPNVDEPFDKHGWANSHTHRVDDVDSPSSDVGRVKQ